MNSEIPAPLSILSKNQDKVMYRGLELRIYPNEKQKILINKTLGSCRFIYNQMLAERKEVFENLKDDKKALYAHKYKTEKELKQEFIFLKEVDSTSLQQARMNLDTAYKNAFDSALGKRKGTKVRFL